VDDTFADICFDHPYISNLVLNRRDRGELSKWAFLKHNLRFMWRIRKQKYDMVIDLHGDRQSSWLSLFSGANYRLGRQSRFKNRFAYNITVPKAAQGQHTSDLILETLLPLDVAIPEDKNFFLRYRESDSEFIKNFLGKYGITENDLIVVIHPGARKPEKQLPAEKFGVIARWLNDEIGAKVVYSGKNDDIADIADIVKESGKRGLLVTNLTFGQLAALIDLSGLYFGNDSAPTQMAAALGVPTVAFFGPSDPDVWEPLGSSVKVVRNLPLMECQPCNEKKVCKMTGDQCMTKIKISEVKRVALNLLSKQSTSQV
jgi:ADP-heptose:LPS heptosyltransferase